MPPPEFLLDRSLGRHQLANALRGEGFIVHTLWSICGAAEEQLEDHVRGNLTGPAQVRWCLANLAAICLACDGPRPFIYNVHERRIVRIWP